MDYNIGSFCIQIILCICDNSFLTCGVTGLLRIIYIHVFVTICVVHGLLQDVSMGLKLSQLAARGRRDDEMTRLGVHTQGTLVVVFSWH